MADQNNKKKSGLHKEISSIFDGVPVPDGKVKPRPHTGPEPGQAGYDSPRPSVKLPQNPQIPGSYPRPGQPEAAQPKTGQTIKTVGMGPLQRIVKKIFAPKPGVSSSRHKVTVVLIPVLLIVLIVYLTKAFDISFFKAKGIVPPEPVTSVGAVSTEITWQKPEPYPSELHDPMQLTDEMAALIEAQKQAEAEAKAQKITQQQAGEGAGDPQATKTGELTVKGILFSADKPSAVIGTRITHVGDIIAGATIVKINRDSVEFERDAETWTQTVEP